jgi:hypothetical protein
MGAIFMSHVKMHRKRMGTYFSIKLNRQQENASYHKVVFDVNVKGQGQTINSHKQTMDQYFTLNESIFFYETWHNYGKRREESFYKVMLKVKVNCQGKKL